MELWEKLVINDCKLPLMAWWCWSKVRHWRCIRIFQVYSPQIEYCVPQCLWYMWTCDWNITLRLVVGFILTVLKLHSILIRKVFIPLSVASELSFNEMCVVSNDFSKWSELSVKFLCTTMFVRWRYYMDQVNCIISLKKIFVLCCCQKIDGVPVFENFWLWYNILGRLDLHFVLLTCNPPIGVMVFLVRSTSDDGYRPCWVKPSWSCPSCVFANGSSCLNHFGQLATFGPFQHFFVWWFFPW